MVLRKSEGAFWQTKPRRISIISPIDPPQQNLGTCVPGYLGHLVTLDVYQNLPCSIALGTGAGFRARADTFDLARQLRSFLGRAQKIPVKGAPAQSQAPTSMWPPAWNKQASRSICGMNHTGELGPEGAGDGLNGTGGINECGAMRKCPQDAKARR